MDRQELYQVKLPLFEGPLDLLLHLIEREELDITTISLASVTDQFIAYLQTLREVQAGVIADFLVVAARLLLIKSRLLLPKPPPLVDEEEDPGEALVRRLLAYKRFKRAAQYLREREQAGLRSYVRLAPPPVLEQRLDLAGVSLHDLVAAMSRVLATLPESQPVGLMVSPRKVTVQEKMALIESLVRGGQSVSFATVLRGAATRVDVVVSFWAVLELIKRGRLEATQPELFGEIVLREGPRVGADNGPAPELV